MRGGNGKSGRRKVTKEKTTAQLEKQLRTHMVADAILTQRIGWFQRTVREPHRNLNVIATVFAFAQWEKTPVADREGEVQGEPQGWMAALFEDLVKLDSYDPIHDIENALSEPSLFLLISIFTIAY